MEKSNESKSSKVNNIILQQCRLRDVNSICIRKLTIALNNESIELDERLSQNHISTLLYFTIHSAQGSNNFNMQMKQKELYSSEHVLHCENPKWSNFKIYDSQVGLATDFVVRLCISHGRDYLPALQWDIPMSQLLCIGESNFNQSVHFNSNAVVVGIRNYFYVPYNCINHYNHLPISTLLPNLDLSACRKSYSKFSFIRILSLQSMKKRNVEAAEKISQKLNSILKNKKTLQLQCKNEDLKEKLKRLKKLLEYEKDLLKKEKELSEKKKKFVELLKEGIEEEHVKFKREYKEFENSRKKYQINVENLRVLKVQRDLRQKDLIEQLQSIFPITYHSTLPNKSDTRDTSNKEFRICDVKLPNAEQFNSKEDLATSVALGFTVQLLIMFSRFTLFPLRYPLNFHGSSSTVYDHATPDIPIEKNRIFPLHYKGSKERMIFKYGFFLLNKNIAQLRFHFGLTTPDLRTTLSNLKSLINGRVKQLSQPSVYVQTRPIEIVRSLNQVRKIPAKNSPTFSEVSTETNSSLKLPTEEQLKHSKSPKIKKENLRSKRQQLFQTSQTKQQNIEDTSNEDDLMKKSLLLPPPINSNKQLLTGLETSKVPLSSKNNHNRKYVLANARAELLGRSTRSNSGRNKFLNLKLKTEDNFDSDEDLC